MTATAIYAAGAVCWRVIDGRIMILVVHRTVHGDVTIPKGKVDPGESLPQTAVREIKEETGLSVALGVPVGISNYAIGGGRTKIVHYWSAEVSDEAIQSSTFVPNGEIAALEWVTIKRAHSYLSYSTDVEILEAFEKLVDAGVTSTFAIVVLRHAKALSRSEWKKSDATRPLSARGVLQAASVGQTITAWHPKRIVSSTATRCVTTVTPLSIASGIEIKRTDNLSEEAFYEGKADVRSVIGKRVRARKTTVLCSHGPLLHDILREISLATGTPTGSYLSDAAALEPAAFSVVHLSATTPGSGIIAIETHSPRV